MQPADVVDHPRGAPRGLLQDVAGGASERSRLQHPAAAEHRRSPSDDYPTPRLGPVPGVHSSQQPDLPTLGRLHGEEEQTRQGKAGITNKFSLSNKGKQLRQIKIKFREVFYNERKCKVRFSS